MKRIAIAITAIFLSLSAAWCQTTKSASQWMGDLSAGIANAQNTANGALPHVANNAALMAYSGPFTTIQRDGFSVIGDGGYAIYNKSSSPCVKQDNGIQVAAQGGGCWIASLSQGLVDIRLFGADATGNTDSTTAIQAAISNKISLGIIIPPGVFKACGLIMPPTYGLVIQGFGTASKLVHGNCGLPLFSWSKTSIVYPEQTIRNLSFDGAAGLADVIDTRGVGGLTLAHLYFGDLPVGYSGILIDGINVANHDDRIMDIRAYPTTAAKSVIHYGPLTSDTTLDGLIAHGHNIVQDIILIDAGANNITMSNSHPYDAARHVLHADGCVNCQFTNVTFDYGSQSDVYLGNARNVTFNGSYFEAIQPGQYGVILNNSSNINFISSIFQAQNGAIAAITETGTSDYNVVIGGSIGTLSYYTNQQAFAFIGAHSYSRNVPGVTPFGFFYSFSGITTNILVSGSINYLGVNGAQTSAGATAYVVPQVANIQTVNIFTDNTPAAGQTFTFDVYDGNTLLGTGIVVSGSYGTIITLNKYVAQFDQIFIKSTFSSSSGSANVRYTATFAG